VVVGITMRKVNVGRGGRGEEKGTIPNALTQDEEDDREQDPLRTRKICDVKGWKEGRNDGRTDGRKGTR
jgi:hypothetical protein